VIRDELQKYKKKEFVELSIIFGLKKHSQLNFLVVFKEWVFRIF